VPQVSVEDRELIRSCLRGDRQAYRALLARYQDPIFGYCLRMIKDSGQAEDIAQEALVRTLTRLENYDERYSFSAWVFKIATNLCIDHLRKAKRIAYSLDQEIEGKDGSFRRELPSPTPDPSERLLAEEQMRMLDAAVAIWAAIFWLFHVLGHAGGAMKGLVLFVEIAAWCVGLGTLVITRLGSRHLIADRS
jgi:RNA polymerase sigma-70 factor (ECF subfamily)